jgi:hypothetical protein
MRDKVGGAMREPERRVQVCPHSVMLFQHL